MSRTVLRFDSSPTVEHLGEALSAFLFIEVTPSDATKFAEYEAGAVQIAIRHGGELLAHDTDPLLIERDNAPAIAVLMKFPDKQAVRAYFDDPDYAPLRELRQSVSRASAIAVGA
ncbi:DUF1330 domain-containing protein [Promicromonospora umidemergens]|uniref:DUF1330 domain-containing protein n=1 Tax=Promicromonospora umidemergens TaxID=629679 RepID=UPI0031E59686